MDDNRKPERGHETLDHTADMGLRGWGPGIPEAFEEIALAMFELIAEPGYEAGTYETSIRCQGRDLDELLVEFLNTLLAQADIDDVVYRSVNISGVKHGGETWEMDAVAFGTPRELAKEYLRAEVKAATYCGVLVEETDTGMWETRCVVDL
ncbi:MAG: archease [bacterium]|nr:MAG: archease [bacterium]